MYGDPVYGEDFFDREEILSLLERRLVSFKHGDKRNLALIGLRKMGLGVLGLFQWLLAKSVMDCFRSAKTKFSQRKP